MGNSLKLKLRVDPRDLPEFTHVKIFNVSKYEIERQFEKNAQQNWNGLSQNWYLTFYISIIYLAGIFALQKFMVNKKGLDLRKPLILWSGLLAAFSTQGMLRMWSDMLYVIQNYGFQMSVCNPMTQMYGPVAVWSYLFILSKVWELGDTLFIVLRKKPLIFLHWYHHITVMVYSFFSVPDVTGPGRWFVTINYTVHAFMYTYYTLSACKIRVPKVVNILLTSMQLLQMVVGMGVCIMVYIYQQYGYTCLMSKTNMFFGIAMYASYLVLFGHYFHKTYIIPRRLKNSNAQHVNGVANGKVSKKIQ